MSSSNNGFSDFLVHKDWMNMIRTILFIVILFLTSFFGSIFLLFPFLPFLWLAPGFYRRCVDRIVGFWESLPVALLEILFGVRFAVHGDAINRHHRAVILMNHRTRLDWMYLWSGLFLFDPLLLTTEKIVLKSALKRIPGAGWAMECNSFIFVHRHWLEDQAVLGDAAAHLAQTGDAYQILFFPEGTDLSCNGINSSNAYAEKYGLSPYNYVLHPRSTGFLHLYDTLTRSKPCYLEYIYDVTIAYPDGVVQSEIEFAKGRYPKSVEFYVRRYRVSDLPQSSEGVDQWLKDRWREKENELRAFYESGHFPPTHNKPNMRISLTARHKALLWFTFVFWMSTLMLWTYFLYLVWWFWLLYVGSAITTFIVIGRMYGGVERLEVRLSNANRCTQDT